MRMKKSLMLFSVLFALAFSTFGQAPITPISTDVVVAEFGGTNPAPINPCNLDAMFNWYDMGNYTFDFELINQYASAGYIIDWSFGDGGTASNLDYVSYTYSADGLYDVTCTVTDPYDPNCFDSYTETISICNVDADFDWMSMGNGEYSFFTWNGYSSVDYNITWDFGDGTVITGSDIVNHTYATSDSYFVSVYIEQIGNPNCWDQVDYWVQVFVPFVCTADADFSWVDQGNMTFDFATIATIDINEFTVDWDFADGGSASGAMATHTFVAPGSYFVECTVSSLIDPSCVDMVTYEVIVTTGGPWTLPAPTGANHTILVPSTSNITIDGAPISDGSYIGVFFNDANGDLVCGGFTYYETTSGNNMFITAWGADAGFDGFATGEDFKWKIWDIATATEFDASATYDLSGAFPNDAFFVANGLSGIVSIGAITTQTQDITINSGWNMISTFIDPFDAGIDSVFASIASQVEIVKNGMGMVYWPLYGINAIGDITIGEGYQVKMVSTQILSVTGLAVAPEFTPISIPSGWSIIGYLRQSAGAIDVMLNPIVGNITIVKNNYGMVYWPLYGINAIGNMLPGQGYQFKTDAAVTLTYPANSVSSKSYVYVPTPMNYTNIQNTGNSMILGIPQQAWDISPSLNSEIAIFNQNGDLLGSSVYTGSNLSVAIWGDDFSTIAKEGISNGETYTIILWDQLLNEEYQLEVISWIEGSEHFEDNGISVVGEFKTSAFVTNSYELQQNVPNPFSTTTTIGFFLAEKSNVQIGIYNVVGELLEVIVSQEFESGEHSIEFNADRFASGAYHYKIISDNFTSTKSMLIQK